MNERISADGPSRSSLIKAALWTFAGAVIVAVLFVLPAEYGVDPTGIGSRIGLTQLAGVSAPDIDTAPRVVQGTWPEAPEEFDYYDPEVLGDPFSRAHETPFRSDRIEIPLDEFEQVEVKASMNQGEAFVYSWRLVEGDTVYTDFHADPHQVDQYPDMYWIRYLESESGGESGSLVAPFDGNHGWFWLNIEENPIKIELEVHGYYENVEEVMRSYQ